MDYIVIDQEDLGMVSPVECGDLSAVSRTILEKMKAGRTPRVFVEVPYDVNVKVREGQTGEIATRKAKPDKSPGGKSNSPVRPGDERATEELGEGIGDHQSNSSAED